MDTNTKLIDYCKENIKYYVYEMMKSSRDSLEILRAKSDIFENVALSLLDAEITDENREYFNIIMENLKGLRGIDGISSVLFVGEKVQILINHIVLLKDLKG